MYRSVFFSGDLQPTASFPHGYSADSKLLSQFRQRRVGMLCDILRHHDIIQLSRGIFPPRAWGQTALGLILPESAIQRISTNLENMRGLFPVSSWMNIRDHSLSKIKAIGIAHAPENSMKKVLIKS